MKKSETQCERRQTLSFGERRELEALEAEQATLYQAMSTPSFYQQGGSEIARAKARLGSIEQELHEAYQHWETLEELNG